MNWRLSFFPLAARMGLLLVLAMAMVAGCGRSQSTDPLAQAMGKMNAPKEKEPSPSQPPQPAKPTSTEPSEQKPEEGAEQGPTTLKLTVLRVSDPRLPDLDEQQFQFFLKTLNGWAVSMSQRQLEFDVQRSVPVGTYFEDHAEVLKAPLAGKGLGIFHFDVLGPDANAGMLDCLAQTNPENLRKYFGDAPPELNSAEAWAEYLVGGFRKKWTTFCQPHPPHPALISKEHPEFSRPGLWRALADDARASADLIVTNAFIAGAERRMGLDRIQRGGLVVGLWSVAGKKTTLGRTLVISVQPVLCRSPFVIDVPDRARPAVAAVYTWRYLQALWTKESQVAEDPLGTAVRLISESLEPR